MSTPRVVITYSGLGSDPIEASMLQQAGAEVLVVEDLTAPALRQADAILLSTQPFTAELIGTLERCKILSRVGVGLDNIAIPAATKQGIWVTNVPDYAIDEVSMHAIALMLMQMRRLGAYAASTRAGKWDGSTASTLRRPGELTLGVLGFGRIGSAAAAKGRGLGLRVLAHDPYVAPETISAAGVEPVDLATLLRTSDYLSLHVPLTAETHHLIDQHALALMSPQAYLINTARGGVVDESALLAVLQAGQLAGAALDVLGTEPPVQRELVEHPNVTVTPHIAWGSAEASHDVRVKGAEEVVRVLRGERPRHPANDITSIQ